MNDETKEFLLECKKAGYEYIAIGVVDKRVPISVKIEKFGERKYGKSPSDGSYWGEITQENDGKKVVIRQANCVCGAPNRRNTGRPAIWDICEKSNLTSGMLFRGVGCGESHTIRSNHNLEKGCYDLKGLT